MRIPPLPNLVFAIIPQVPLNHFRMGKNADVPALCILKGFLVALIGQIQPHSISLVTNRGVVGQDMEDNHVPGIFVKPGQVHIVMPFVILGTGTDTGFLHELGNSLSCHSGTSGPDPLR